jgi:class 3 adenylate cyclase/tetratricopeptide (TPR) repeat protein
MRCPGCGSESVAGKKYCSECGSELARVCAHCDAINPSFAKSCGRCRAPLDAVPPMSVEPRLSGATVTAERRHLTILFCDLVGSVMLTSQLDPEEWRATVADYRRAASEAITRFGGEVMRYVGDGIMAFFGYPVAHDNDAERAARAGLAILDAIAKLNESQSGKPKLSLRIGIDSGSVVVGTGAGQEVDAFGDAANIAARLQMMAEPDSVVVTGATHRLISGLFVVEDRGAQNLEGIEQPLQLYRVARLIGMRSRFEAAVAAGGLTPFVGREDELGSLLMRWERVREGEGQMALIVGEAGIGKSRLVQRFHETIAGTPHTWVEAGARAFFQNTPLYPVSETLRQLTSGEQDSLASLALRLEAAGLAATDALPLLAPLLNLPLPPEYRPSTLPPEQQRRRLLATLVEWMLGAARAQPLVSFIEDLHWADPTTVELIQLLVEQGTTAPLMLLYTARPEFRASWPLRTHHTQVNLDRLSVREARTMVREVAPREALADETVAAVVERSGGVPLFVEELTRAVLESGGGNLTGAAIPVTLRDSLMARLDRLGPAREVAQIGAVIGREFSYELLHAVHQIPEAELQTSLRELTEAELTYVRGITPDATYQFKHALIRDAAYEALLKRRRRELHRRVAVTIAEKFPDFSQQHPEVLARHWTEAGETEKAITEWSRAGEAARSRHAFREALANYNQAAALLDLLPQSPERDLRELEIRQSLVQMLHLTRGYSAPESIDATQRVVALVQKSGNVRQLLNLMLAMCVNALSSGDLPAAGNLANQALELASRKGGSTSFFGRVRALQMIVRYYRGDLPGVEKHFAAGLKFFEDAGFRQVPAAGAIPFGFASWNAWTLGEPHLARQHEAKMLAIVNRDNPFEMAFLGFLVAQLRIWTRQYDQAERSAASAVELSDYRQFPWLAALARAALGYARARLGRTWEGIALLRQGLAGLHETGSRFGVTNVAASLAETCAGVGALMEASAAVEQGLRTNPDELVSRPYIFQVRGELRLKQQQMDTAEGDFQESIALARKMGAKAWELRAAMSLARLLRDDSRRDQARAILAGIYNRFTEGFDTADLKDAKALLEELSS